MPHRILHLAFFLLSSCGVMAAAYAADIPPLAGEWRGTAVESTGGIDTPANELFLKFEPADKGFDLEWKVPGGAAESARFIQTEGHPGVFSTQKASRGLFGVMSWFSGELNPLDGDPLIWARSGADTLVFYKLVIDEQGAFTLDRYETVLEGGALRLHFTRRSHDKPEQSLAVKLEREQK